MLQKRNRDKTKELAEEIDLHDDMITSLVELLEQKGILTQNEWEAKVRGRTREGKRLISFRRLNSD